MSNAAEESPRRFRRWPVLGALAAVLAAGAAAAVVLTGRNPAAPAGSADGLPPATATVTRTTLTEVETVGGMLGHGPPVPLVNRLPGTVTAVAAVGTVVQRGQPLYSVDQRPVVLLHGPVPAYRTLEPGVTGDDVRQLEENLRELGYRGFTVDADYTSATATAVRRWRDDLGLDDSGAVELGRVVFTPAAVRIATLDTAPGRPAGPDEQVLGYTDPAKLVTADVEVAALPMVTPGTGVTVTLPDRSTVPATVAGVAPADDAREADAPPVAEAAAFTVTFTVADQGAVAALQGAPVTVGLTGQRRDDVLAVPVAALLALREGGYGVQVVDGRSTTIVAVRTGLFADGLVEISGAGIVEGTTVGVPRS